MTRAALPAGLAEAVAVRLDWLARSCAAIRLGGGPAHPVSSMVGGHPYLPAGLAWPVTPAGPLTFVAQVNFAEVPPVPGFPRSGLLQWFVEPNDVYGLTFDESAGARGFHVRWFAEPYRPATAAPNAAVPATQSGFRPMELTGPAAMTFTPATALPAWSELPPFVQQDPVWPELAATVDPRNPSAQWGYEECARADAERFGRHAAGSKVGGFATFTQYDPRGSGQYAPASMAEGTLLLELDSAETGGWGDGGIAHLFGNPAAVARGDLGSVRYHWDCF